MEKSRLYLERVDEQNITFPPSNLLWGGFQYKKVSKITKISKHIFYVEYEFIQEVLYYTHLVLATKIKLELIPSSSKNGNKKYRLSIEDHEWILEALNMREDPNGVLQWLYTFDNAKLIVLHVASCVQ